MRDVLARGSEKLLSLSDLQGWLLITFICTDMSHNTITWKGGPETGQLLVLVSLQTGLP
jgi:hypothetical protein